MSSGVKVIIIKLQDDPETLSDDELTKTTLSVFSKCLGAFTSRRIINAYLRWLEVQRTAPRKNINFNWLNTIAHWTQSLRARGFSLEEISREVMVWKEEKGPFFEPNPSDPESRLPPTLANLTFGWDRTPLTTKIMTNDEKSRTATFSSVSTKYDPQIEHKLDSPLTKVPTSYICNRCKGRGHYVGDCPTNEDPSYDIPAGADYICKFCKEHATHYFLFCPENPDLNSIYRRRQQKAFLYMSQSLSRDDADLERASRSTQSSPQSSQSATLTRSNIVIPKFASARTDFELFTSSNRKSSREVATGRLTYENGDENIEMDTRSASIVDNQPKSRTGVKIPVVDRLQILESADSEIFWEKITNEIQRDHSRNTRKQLEDLPELAPIDQTLYIPAAHIAINPSRYAAFIGQLFKKHPNQVNPLYRPRMKALDMWDFHDKKARHLDTDETLTISELGSSAELRMQDQKAETHICEKFDSQVDGSMDSGGERNARQSKQFVEQIGFMMDAKVSWRHRECKSEQTESHNSHKKLRAIQRKINSIENLKTRLELGDDVDSLEMEQMASDNLSQEILDNIANQLQTQNTASESQLSSSFSEFPSPLLS